MQVAADGVDVEFDGRVLVLLARSRFSSWLVGGRERRIDVADIGNLAVKRRRNGAVRQLSLALATGRIDLTAADADADIDPLVDALLAAGLKEIRRIPFTSSSPALPRPVTPSTTQPAPLLPSRTGVHERLHGDLVALVDRRTAEREQRLSALRRTRLRLSSSTDPRRRFRDDLLVLIQRREAEAEQAVAPRRVRLSLAGRGGRDRG